MSDPAFLRLPFFEERHRRFAEEVADFAASAVPALVDHHDVDFSCRRLVAALAEAGLLRHTVIVPHGGAAQALDVRTLCLARETLAAASGLADFAFAMQGLGSGPVSLFGTPEQLNLHVYALTEQLEPA